MRKTILVIACLVGLTAPATAYDADIDVACRHMGVFAGESVDARYRGVSVAQSMQALPRNAEAGWLEAYLRAVLVDAYDLPFASGPARDLQRREYVNTVEALCWKFLMDLL